MFWQQKSYLGFDIGAGGVKLVELRKEKNRPVLNTFGLTYDKQDVHELSEHQKVNVSGNVQMQRSMTNNPNDGQDTTEIGVDVSAIDELKVEEYVIKIKELCRASKVTSKSAVVSLPVSSVFHAIVTLPTTKNSEELKHLIRAEVKKFVPFSLEEMSLDYQIINENDKESKTQKVMVNAVPNKLISFYARIFQKAGLTLEALEPESAALTRSLIGRDKAVSMIIDMGAERTNFFIVENGVPITHQSIDFGGNKVDKLIKNITGLEDEYIDQLKTDVFDFYTVTKKKALTQDRFIETFMPVIDPIIKEISLSFDLYSRQMGSEIKYPEKIIFSGGMSFMPYLTDYVAEVFKMKCYIGDPWGRLVYQESLKPILNKNGPRMAVAIGLALRSMV